MEEDEGFLTVDIMRLGSMQGMVKVQYSTDACRSRPVLTFSNLENCVTLAFVDRDVGMQLVQEHARTILQKPSMVVHICVYV